jgi:hypothetical protein
LCGTGRARDDDKKNKQTTVRAPPRALLQIRSFHEEEESNGFGTHLQQHAEVVAANRIVRKFLARAVTV